MAGHTRRAGRRGPAPFRQGDLDGLCGVYAIVNAMRLLCPKLDRAKAERLFEALLRELPQGRTDCGPAAICHGVSRGCLRRMITVTRRQVRQEFGVAIRLECLGNAASRIDAPIRLEWLWATLAEKFDTGAIAIVGIGGRHNHWSVAMTITPRMLWLADSSGMQAVRRGAGMGTDLIEARDVFVVSRRT